MTPMKICIDPGHGGHDPGAVSPHTPFLIESKINLAVANKTAALLRSYGHTVTLTRTLNKYISLAERVAAAREAGAEFFLSIHCNSASNQEAHGIESWIWSGDVGRSYPFAEQIQKTVLAEFYDHRDRGIKTTDTLYVLKHVTCPAVLLECEFLSHKKMGHLLSLSETHDRYAKAIAASFLLTTDTPYLKTQILKAIAYAKQADKYHVMLSDIFVKDILAGYKMNIDALLAELKTEGLIIEGASVCSNLPRNIVLVPEVD